MRNTRVRVRVPRSLNEETVTIIPAAEGGGFMLLDKDGIVLAEHSSARKLSNHAFDSGAAIVTHPYNLKLSEDD